MEFMFSAAGIEGFAFMLLHSLWQFTLIGIVVLLLVRKLKMLSPSIRYWMVGCSLCLFPLIAIISWSQLSQPSELVIESMPSAYNEDPIISSPSTQTMEASSRSNPLKTWVRTYSFYILLFWCCGILVLGFKMLIGQIQLLQLRAWGQVEVGKKWRDYLKVASDRMGLHQAVHLAESHLVKEPITFGFLKPVILFPIGLLNNLEMNQVEAILLHELAHIKRHDYLINLLQALLETFFFYHPIVWLLSKELRLIREECCDDLVLEQGINSMAYAESLLTLARLINAQNNQFVMSTNSSNSAIGTRIKRLFVPTVFSTKFKPFSALLLLLMLLLVTAHTGISLHGQNQVSVEVDHMNVFYIGVDNTINVVAEGVSSNEIVLTSDQLDIEERGAGKYLITAEEEGTATLKVSGPTGLIREAIYKVRRFPDPIAKLGWSIGGPMYATDFKSQTQLTSYVGIEYPNPCKITDFNITYVAKRQDPVSWTNAGPIFSQETLEITKQAKAGDLYYIDKINCQCGTEKEVRKIGAMVFSIAGEKQE